MSQDTAQIRKVQDKEGTQFFPITHVDAVIDQNGDAVSTLLAGKQATLVSGTNIKTINSQSLLGSGNIVIEGGGGGSIDSIVMNGDAVTVTGGVADLGTVITQHQDISGKADKVSNSTNGNFAGLDAGGNLTDSGHKHSDYQAALVSGTNIKTVNSTSLLGSGNVSVGTYSKPSGGIPKTDLASAVQTSLGKADTALQSYTETDPVFTASAAAGIASTDISAWNAKLSGVTFNGVSATVTGGVAAITATIPAAPGTLQTNLTTAQTASASEALSGSIKLHKIAKTGTYSDLIGTPTIPTKVSDLTNDAGYTTNTGTVTRVDIGTSQYSPTSGIVSLPAYPTTLPASDVSAWAKASTKPSYAFSEITGTASASQIPNLSWNKITSDKPTTLSGYGITDAVEFDQDILDLGATHKMGYGYTTHGWPYSGPAMTFGSGKYTAQIQSSESGNHLYYRQTVNGTAQSWVEIYHSGNSNKSDVAWACSTLTASGNATIAGNVGIGTTSPSYNLVVAGTIMSNQYRLSYDGSLAVWTTSEGVDYASYGPETVAVQTSFDNQDPQTSSYVTSSPGRCRLVLQPRGGRVGIGTYAPTQALHVAGNILATGTITPGSDSRIKDNKKDISQEIAFSVIENLKPKTWVWNEKSNENLSGKSAAGLVAQEVKEILPDAVTISENGDIKDFHSLNYNTIQGYEIAAIKGLIKEVKSLKAEIAELKKQIK